MLECRALANFTSIFHTLLPFCLYSTNKMYFTYLFVVFLLCMLITL